MKKAAIDTAVLVDILAADPRFGPTSRTLVEEHYQDGALVVCEVVYAELSPLFEEREALDDALAALSIEVEPLGRSTAYLAGSRWRSFRARGGPRTRIIADFLIGAHAERTADILLTRDRKFYATNYPELRTDDGIEGA